MLHIPFLDIPCLLFRLSYLPLHYRVSLSSLSTVLEILRYSLGSSVIIVINYLRSILNNLYLFHLNLFYLIATFLFLFSWLLNSGNEKFDTFKKKIIFLIYHFFGVATSFPFNRYVQFIIWWKSLNPADFILTSPTGISLLK